MEAIETQGNEPEAAIIGGGDSVRISQMFGTARKLQETKSQIKAIKDKQKSVIQSADELDGGVDAAIDHIMAAISDHTVESIEALSREELYNIFTVDGKLIELYLKFDQPEKEEIFYRDYLIMLKEGAIAEAALEEKMKELDDIFAESRDEYNKVLAEYGDFNSFLENQIREQYEKAEGISKENIGRVLTVYDNAATLVDLIEHYSKNYAANTFSEYKRPALAQPVFARYQKAMNKIGFTKDITSHYNLELKLDEKYHPYKDLFLYAVIKYFAYKKNPSKLDAVHMSAIINNVIDLEKDQWGLTEKTQERVNTFKTSIQKLLDIFIG